MNVRPFGDAAVLVEVAGRAEVAGADAVLTAAALAPGAEVLPGYDTVVVTLPAPVDGIVDLAAAALRRERAGTTVRPPAREVTIAVVYDGPDLDEVAAVAGLTRAEVVARHTAAAYDVAFLGFAPGFPYLDGLDAALQLPRRATPRTVVPAGSVGIGGGQTGVYPTASPGGWHLLGRTDVVLFDPDRAPPALVAPGDRVRFAAVDHVGPVVARPPRPLAGGAVRVLVPGATTVQDLGRPGFARLGVPHAGAADPDALRAANAVVGNPPGAAALEAALVGPRLRFEQSCTFAVTGAADLDGRPVVPGRQTYAGAGQVLTVAPVRTGCRVYVAFAGGVDVPPVLGSRSHCSLSGLGPPPFAAGDGFALGPPLTASGVAAVPPPADHGSLRVLPGPHLDRVVGDAWAALLAGPHEVAQESSRSGVRLAAPLAGVRSRGDLPSLGMVTGAVQLPPDGRPVVLLPDHGTTGGYPVIAVVVSADRSRLGQLRPGTPVRFAPA